MFKNLSPIAIPRCGKSRKNSFRSSIILLMLFMAAPVLLAQQNTSYTLYKIMEVGRTIEIDPKQDMGLPDCVSSTSLDPDYSTSAFSISTGTAKNYTIYGWKEYNTFKVYAYRTGTYSITLYVDYWAGQTLETVGGYRNTGVYIITVIDRKAVDLSFDKTEITIGLGEKETITPEFLPAETSIKVLNWTSSDENVATVDQNGTVTGHSVGVTTITGTTTDDSNISRTCVVTVIDKDNYLVIDDCDVISDKVSLVPIYLNNKNNILGLQFDIQLPENTTLAQNSSNRYYINLSEDRGAYHSYSIGGNDREFTITIYSNNNDEIEGHDGVLCYIPIAASGAKRRGQMRVSNIHLSKTGNVDVPCAPFDVELFIKPTNIGDANGDGKVTIADFTATISYIIKLPSSGFDVDAADIDDNGQILISDATAILNMVLNPRMNTPKRKVNQNND